MKQYTADPEILQQVDFVAYNQDDLEEILHEEDTNVVYLCQNSFTFPSGMLRKKDMRYVGIGKDVEVTVKLADNSSLSDLNISFENVTVHEVCVNTTMNKSTEKADESKESTSEWWKRTDFLSEAIYRLCSEETSSKYMTLRDKPIFLFDDTIKKIDGFRRDFISRLCLQKDETLICIMPVSEGLLVPAGEKVYVAFSNRAVYTSRTTSFSARLNNPDVIKYSDIEDVIFLEQIKIKVCKKNGSSDKFPCNWRWGRAIRRFLMLAADKGSIKDNEALYYMEFESLDGKTLGQMLVS